MLLPELATLKSSNFAAFICLTRYCNGFLNTITDFCFSNKSFFVFLNNLLFVFLITVFIF